MDVLQFRMIALTTILLTATGCAIQEAGDREAPRMNLTEAQAASLKAVVAAVEEQALALPRKQTTSANIAQLFGEEDTAFVSSLTNSQRDSYIGEFRPYLIDTVQREAMSYHRRGASSVQGARAGYIPAVPAAGMENQ